MQTLYVIQLKDGTLVGPFWNTIPYNLKMVGSEDHTVIPLVSPSSTEGKSFLDPVLGMGYLGEGEFSWPV